MMHIGFRRRDGLIFKKLREKALKCFNTAFESKDFAIIAPSLEVASAFWRWVSGCSAARLAHHVRDVEVGSSNLLTPTDQSCSKGRLFFFH